jgi:hypothetical protein
MSNDDFVLYTVDVEGTNEAMPETTWPRVLQDAERDFADFPNIMELWLYADIRHMNDRVLLWSRL